MALPVLDIYINTPFASTARAKYTLRTAYWYRKPNRTIPTIHHMWNIRYVYNQHIRIHIALKINLKKPKTENRKNLRDWQSKPHYHMIASKQTYSIKNTLCTSWVLYLCFGEKREAHHNHMEEKYIIQYRTTYCMYIRVLSLKPQLIYCVEFYSFFIL